MKYKHIRKPIVSVLIMMLLVLVLVSKVYAASFSVSAGNSNLNVGGTTTLTISTADCAGVFNISSSNPSVVSISSESEFVDGSISITLTAKASGSATITVSPVDVTDSAYNPITQSKSVNINVSSPAPTVSSNANLSNLGITPLTYDFNNFSSSSSNTKYYATVPNNITSVGVYATVQDPKAKYSVSGNYNNLQVGTNNITVKVTAEAGNTKTYTIGVTRKSPEVSEPVVPNVVEEQVEEEPVLSLAISTIGFEKSVDENGNEIDNTDKFKLEPEFKPDIFEYKMTLTENLETIPFVITPNRETAEIEIKGNEKLVEGENLVEIIVTDKEKEESVIYKITVNKEIKEEEIIEPPKEEVQETEEWWTSYEGIIKYLGENPIYIGITAAIAVIILLIIILIIRKHIKKNRDYDYENEDFKQFEGMSKGDEKSTAEIDEQQNLEKTKDSSKKQRKGKGRRYL